MAKVGIQAGSRTCERDCSASHYLDTFLRSNQSNYSDVVLVISQAKVTYMVIVRSSLL